MPSAAWIAAAKKTPMEPAIYVACESVDAISDKQNLASEWNAGTQTNVEVFSREGGGAGVRPKLYTYNGSQVTWKDWDFPPANLDGLELHDPRYTAALAASEAEGGYSPWFAAPATGFLESIHANWQVSTNNLDGVVIAGARIAGWDAHDTDDFIPGGMGYARIWRTLEAHTIPLLRLGEYAAGATVPGSLTSPFHETAFGITLADRTFRNIYPYDNTDFCANFRAKTGTITTKTFDLGVVPNLPSRVLIEHMVQGTASIVYTAQGSANNSTWVDLGTVADGGEMAPYRYYRLTAVMTSTGYHTPELYSIRIVGGNSQYVYFGDHAGEPAVAGSEVSPYLKGISSVSSKIALKDKPTVGDCTMTLALMPKTSDLVQSTGKRRSVTVYLGFVGLAVADYEPYFTGVWDGYTSDPDKRTFTVKLRDVHKKFKAKVPEQQSKGGATIPIDYLFGHALDGSDTNSPLNILDAIVQVADLARVPDRYIDKTAFAALKAASFSGSEWNVCRRLTEQKDSDDLLKELAVTAGVFLVPSPNGKLSPIHYDTAVAQTPAVTLDAAQIQFTNMTPDMADTVTRHNIYFNLGTDDQGRKLGGGNPSDYRNIYIFASDIAETDREEVVVGEWFDNWGLAASTPNGTPNPLTNLASRLASWYTPIANVGGKNVATTKTTVQAANVPLRYYADVMPGKIVYVNNLRLPCPLTSWEGFSANVKFMVMSWAVDTKNFTLKLDLLQVDPFTYTANPTWYSYNQWDLYPQATDLALIEQPAIAADGSIAVQLALSFTPPADFRTGYYEVWVSDTGDDWTLATTIPSGSGRDVATATIPARTGGDYRVAVVTVNARGVRQAITDAPQIAAAVAGTAAIPTPANTGVVVSGGGTTFTGRNCLLTWDASSLPASLLGGYRVEILSLADVVKRTVTVADARFLYTYGMNLDDFAGTPASSFKVRVSTINQGGSAATPQTITVTNSAPAAPTGLTTAGQLMSVQLAATYVTPEDFDCLEVWSSATNDRATLGGNPTATIKTGAYTHTGLAAAAVQYYWIRVRDIYGQVSPWYPSSATGGVQGTSQSDPSQVLRLLNDSIPSDALTKYLTGAIPMLQLLDVGSDAFTPEAATPSAAATILQSMRRASSEVLSQGGKIATIADTIATQGVNLEGLNATVAGLITNDYDPLRVYNPNEYARYLGDVYRCKLTTTAGILPTNTTYWEPASSMLTLVSELHEDVDYLNGEILNKVSTVTYDLDQGALQLADSTIDQKADRIDSKVKATTLALLGGEIFDPTRRYLVDAETISGTLQYRCIVDLPNPPLGYAPADDPTHWVLVPASGRMTVAESGIQQNADTITIHAQSIVGPLAFTSEAALPSASIFGPEDIVGLNARLTRTAIKLDSANADIQIQASRVDSVTGRISAAEIDIDGANAAILLRATKDEVSGQVDVLSDMIGLKLNATGTVGAGMLISAPSGGKSTIQFWSDCLQVCMPDGTGIKPLLTTGLVGGVSSIGINGNLFIDGSISATAIDTDTLLIGENIFMAPGATLSWGDIGSGKPTSLASLDSAASSKLSGIAAGATLGADWNSNVTNRPTIPTVPSYITSTKITATTIESPTITAGTITGSTIQTASTGQRFVVDAESNTAKFYNDITGDGIAEVAWIGNGEVFGDGVGNFGLTDGLVIGVYGKSGTLAGVYGVSTHSIGVSGSGGTYGGAFGAGSGGSILLGGSGEAPASPNGGAVYFNSADHHFYGWNGTSWKQLDN